MSERSHSKVTYSFFLKVQYQTDDFLVDKKKS